MKFLKNAFKSLLILVGLLYVVGCIFLYFYQENMIFYPNKLDESQKLRAGIDIDIPVEKDVAIHAAFIEESKNREDGLIIYLHGNKGDVNRAISQARSMIGHGESILIPDYRGFGKSDGYIHSEKHMMSDMQAVYDYALTMYREDQISIVGYSLGSAMASYLAAHNKPKQLVLVAPFTSMLDMKNKFAWFIPDFILKYHLHNDEYLASIDCPIYMMHGEEDELIPASMSRTLQEINPDKIRMMIVPNERHRSVIFCNELHMLCDDIF